MRLAIVGSGIAGMTAAHLLHDRHEVHLFEADQRPGGHAHTITVDLPGGPVAADTGFLVYNERTYPLFTRLLGALGVATQPSDMSFSLSDARSGLEWRGTSLSTVFAQRRNVARPAFLAMLADVARFNRLVQRLLARHRDAVRQPRRVPGRTPLVARLPRLVPGTTGFGDLVRRPRDLHADPARTFAEFFGRHGLLGPGHHPAWRTVTGGSTRYVQAILEPLTRRGRLHRGPRSPRSVASPTASNCSPRRADDLRPRDHGHPQRPGPGAAGRSHRRGAARPRRASATSATEPRCTPTPACCRQTPRLGVVELPARPMNPCDSPR